MAPALPAVVNHHEARAYANWLSAKQVGAAAGMGRRPASHVGARPALDVHGIATASQRAGRRCCWTLLRCRQLPSAARRCSPATPAPTPPPPRARRACAATPRCAC